MWHEIFKRWIDLLFWWVPRHEATSPERAEERAPGAPEERPDGVPEEAVEGQARAAEDVAADDLTVIKGIGPAVQEKLRSLGIATFSDLARADPKTLTERLKGSQPISEARVRAWTDAARERTGA